MKFISSGVFIASLYVVRRCDETFLRLVGVYDLIAFRGGDFLSTALVDLQRVRGPRYLFNRHVLEAEMVSAQIGGYQG